MALGKLLKQQSTEESVGSNGNIIEATDESRGGGSFTVNISLLFLDLELKDLEELTMQCCQ